MWGRLLYHIHIIALSGFKPPSWFKPPSQSRAPSHFTFPIQTKHPHAEERNMIGHMKGVVQHELENTEMLEHALNVGSFYSE